MTDELMKVYEEYKNLWALGRDIDGKHYVSSECWEEKCRRGEHFATLAMKEIEELKEETGVAWKQRELDEANDRIAFLENELQKYKQIGSGWGMVELTDRITQLEDIIKRAKDYIKYGTIPNDDDSQIYDILSEADKGEL